MVKIVPALLVDRGLCPRTPGIYRFRARIALESGEQREIAPLAIPATEAALESHPCVALSSVQSVNQCMGE